MRKSLDSRIYKPACSLPSLSLTFTGWTFADKCRLLRETGWDGIEYFDFSPDRITEYRAFARSYGLRFSLHQPWSYAESGGMFSNFLLQLLRILPKDGYALEDISRGCFGELFVTYGDRFEEVRKLLAKTERNSWAMFAFQTASTWIDKGLSRTHRMGYDEFISEIIEGMPDVPIVVDTVHLIEMMLRAPTGKQLMEHSEDCLADSLLRGVRKCGLYEGRILEIHWNDISRAVTDGRCLPGDGKMSKGLHLLSRELRDTNWGGCIIPEVSPFALFPHPRKKLIALRKRMDEFFAPTVS